MTISTIEYALMAGNAYFDTRDKINRIPYPGYLGWDPISGELNHKVGTDGFEARAFVKGNELVISYAGTDSKDLFGDILADIALGLGFPSNQLLQAVQYYLDVKNANPDAHITLTGYSLGRGLAALNILH